MVPPILVRDIHIQKKRPIHAREKEVSQSTELEVYIYYMHKKGENKRIK